MTEERALNWVHILMHIVEKDQLMYYLEEKWGLVTELTRQVGEEQKRADEAEMRYASLLEVHKVVTEKVIGQDPEEALAERTLLASEGIPEETGEEGAA